MAQLSPIPYRTPLLDERGLVTRNWQQWFEGLLARVGGANDTPALDVVDASNIANEFVDGVGIAAQFQTDLEALALLQAFEDVPSLPLGDDLDFETPSPAQLEAVARRLNDLEIMSAFAI